MKRTKRIIALLLAVALCLPLTAETEGMCDEAFFAKMKQGSFFLNIARGGIVVDEALKSAVLSGHLAGAAVDVLSTEPMAQDCPLFGIENCTLTPHVAWAPIETRVRLMGIVTGNIRAFIDGKPVNVVS